MHVRKGDQVVVIAGKEKGKRGRVLRLLTEKERVVIERINMVKRHTKPTQRNPRGGILEKEGSVEASNVALWCGKCVRPAPREASSDNEGQKKRRVCVKCGTVVRDRVEEFRRMAQWQTKKKKKAPARAASPR